MSKKAASNKCATKYCRNKITSKCRHKKCPKCRLRIWRKKYPGKAAYANKRSHAKYKGLEFTLTLADFFECWVPGHVIDRIDATQGYHKWNIQPLTKFENDSKGATIDKKAHMVARSEWGKNGKQHDDIF